MAIGLPFAAHLAHALGRIDADRVEEHYRVVRAYGLGDRLPAGVDTDRLLELMGRDKKALRGLTFVLEYVRPDGVHDVDVVDGIDPAAVRAALMLMTERSMG